MIQGKKRTEAEYRKLPVDSSSTLKEFANNRKAYYKKYVLGEKIEDEEDSKAVTMGRIVECLLLEKDTFDSKFYMSTVTSIPDPNTNMGKFVESLYKNSRNKDLTFEDAIKAAYVDSGYKWNLDKVLEKFNGSDAEIYFNEICTIRDKGLTVVTLQDIQNAERIVEELKTNDFTAPIIGLLSQNNPDIEVHVQYQVDGFEIDGLPLKGMFDILVISHKAKTIQVYDLKCTFAVENFLQEYYLYRKAYIQAYVYKEAAYFVKQKLGLDYYTVENPKFIVCDSISYFDSLIYELTDKDMKDAYLGFTVGNREYEGVKVIIENLKWARDNDMWRISRNNHLNKGIVKINGK